MKDELLSKISKLIKTQEISESEVDHFMTLIRKLQERTGDHSHTFSLLDLFCDWTKHTALDRNAKGQSVIIELNEKLFTLKGVEDNNTLIEEISRVISFERLQVELTAFLSKHELPLDIVTEKKLWLRYVVQLINIVSNCTLNLPVKRRSLVKNKIKEGIVAVSLKYTWINQEVFTQARSAETVLALVIELSDTTTIVVPCKILGKFLTAKNNEDVVVPKPQVN